MFQIKRIHYSDFLNEFKDTKIVSIKKKREREVYFLKGPNLFFKLWVQNWTQSDITMFGIKSGFYNSKNIDSLRALLYDESGERGYVQALGESAAEKGKSDKCWDKFVKITTFNQRYNFLMNIFESAISAGGTYADLAPCNIIIYNNNINFIDLESFRSFDLIFDGKRKEYEKFELDAWWKPHETAKRDVNKFYKAYFLDCLDIDLKFEIDSIDNFKNAYNILKTRGKNE